LLHGGLLDVPFLGDQGVERGDQGIYVAEGGGDGVLLGKGRKGYPVF
jgi:hypothetical protein